MAAPPNGAKPYEPPHIERALPPEDLEREALYAGEPGPSRCSASGVAAAHPRPALGIEAA